MSETRRPGKWLRWAVVFGVGVLAACSDGGGGGGGVSVPEPASTSAPGSTTGVTAAPTQTTTIDPSASTLVPGTVAVTAPATAPATVAEPTTTIAPLTDADLLAASKVLAAFEALPEEWTGSTSNVLNGVSANSGSRLLSACLGPDDYDLDMLDAESAASLEMAAAGPPAVANAPAPTATVGARVFKDEVTADSAFATLTKLLSTNEGLDCLAEKAPRVLAGLTPPNATFAAEAQAATVEGAEIGARVLVKLVAGGAAADLYVDVVATQRGDLILFATFFSYQNPVDPAVASAVFAAAVADRP